MPGSHILDVQFPEREPSGAPSGDREEIRSNPNMFGGLTGEGLSRAGESMVHGAEAGFGALIEQDQLNNQIHASELNSDFYNKGTDLVSQHTQLEGRAAMDALPGLKQKLIDLQKDTEGASGNLQTKAMVATNTRYALDRLMSIATTHSDTQRNQWAKKTSQDNVLSATNFGALSINAGQMDFGQLDQQMRTITYEAHNRWDGEFSNLEDKDQQAALDLEVAKTKGGAVVNWVKTASENEKDPDALTHAVQIFEHYTKDIDPESRLKVGQYLKTAVFNRTAGRLANFYATPPNRTADDSLSPEMRGLLDTITGSETNTGGYNELYTGKDVQKVKPGYDYSDHPRVMFPAQYGPTSAFGRYQITKTTWDEDKDRYGLTDITPVSQDQWAAKKAQERYTGAWQGASFKQFDNLTGNLDADLQANKDNPQFLSAVGHALSGEWTSLPGGLQPNDKTKSFVMRFQKNIAVNRGETPALDPADVADRIANDPMLKDRPELRQAVMKQALAKVSEQSRINNAQYKQVKDQSDQAEWELFKNIHSGQPVTLAQIDAAPVLPEAKKRLVEQLEKQTGADIKDAKTYGSGFYDLYKRVHAANDDPQRITDPGELYAHVGPNGDLTVAGVEKLRTEIEGKKTVQGEAEAQMKKTFLQIAESRIAPSNALGVKLPHVNEDFQRFQSWFFDAYEKARAQGKTAAELLTPGTKEYLGNTIASYESPLAKQYEEFLSNEAKLDLTAAPATFDIASVKTLPDVTAALRAHNINAQQARDLVTQHPEWGVNLTPMPAVPQSR